MDKFEEWFASQNFYANMRFIHGDGLFIKDGEVYRVLPVQMSWKSWQSRQAEFDAMTEALLNQTQLLAKQKAEVEEKDKRIEEACESINSFFDNQVSTPTPREYANFIAEILEVLRGEHE